MGLRYACEMLVRKTEWKRANWEGNDNVTPGSRVLLENFSAEKLVKKTRFAPNEKVHNRIHKSLPPVPTVSHIKLIHNFPPCFLIIDINTILLPMA
jgi:hypothetical protein